MFVDGNAATVVGNGYRSGHPCAAERDLRRVTIHGFVDRVVQDFPDQVVQASHPTPPMYMPGRLRTGFEAFEGDNVFGVVVRFLVE